MRLEIKNWLGVVVLLCLGFTLGRVTVLSGVNAKPQESEIGRYQLVAGTNTNSETGEKTETVFRIDTKTGEVHQWMYSLQAYTDEEVKKFGGKLYLDQGWYELKPVLIVPDSLLR